MVAQPRQLALHPEPTVQLPLELRPMRDGCAVNDCDMPVVAVLVNNVDLHVCAFDRDRLKALGFKERSLL